MANTIKIGDVFWFPRYTGPATVVSVSGDSVRLTGKAGSFAMPLWIVVTGLRAGNWTRETST